MPVVFLHLSFVCVCGKGGGGGRIDLIINRNHTYKFYVNTFCMLKIKYMMMAQMPEVFSSG